MARFLITLSVNAVALWFTALIVSGVAVVPYSSDTWAPLITYLMVAFIFGVVNTFIGGFVRIVAFPLYILTLGLISFLVNGLLLLLVAGISDLIGFGLVVDDLWSGILGALVLGIVGWLLGIIVRAMSGTRQA